jgi:hypothetical protein
MINIKINKKKYKVPNEFSELSIGTYQELSKIEVLDKKNSLEYIKILSGIEIDILKKIKLTDIKKITNNLLYFFDKNEFKLVEAVEINKKIFVFDDDLQNMNFEMFIDLDELTKDQDTIIDNLHLIMAILYREKRKRTIFNKKLYSDTYDSKSIKERADFFKENLMMDKVLGALFFFINLRMIYIQNTVDYLEGELVKN